MTVLAPTWSAASLGAVLLLTEPPHGVMHAMGMMLLVV
jgi:hypothetical protein